MNKFIVVPVSALLLLISVAMRGQTPSILLMAKDTSFRQSHSMILAGGSGAIGSNAMDIAFLKKMAWGGHIEPDHIDRISNRMKDINRFGMNGGLNLQFLGFSDSLFKLPDWGMKVLASTNYNAFLGYSKNLFELIYKGNSMFKGKEARLSRLTGEYQAYQKFGVGIFNKKSFSGATLSIVSGQDYHRVNVSDAQLYTSPLADSLSLSYNGDYFRADTSKTGWGAGKGWGFATDFEYNLPLKSGKGYIAISVLDIGAIAWSRSSEYFRFDSLTTWTGFTTDDLLRFSADSLRLDGLSDSIHFERTQKMKWKALPASVHLRLLRNISENNFYEAGLSIRPDRTTPPLVYAGLSHAVSQHLIFSERISVGGYGRWGLGAEVQWVPKGKWLLRVGSNNLPGFIINDARSVDLYFSVGCIFKRVPKQSFSIAE